MIIEADVPIAVAEWPGDDPPVLYAHATGFHKMVWRKVIDAVGRHAYALDFRGHGDSGKPTDGYDWRLFGSEVLAVIDQLGLPTSIDAIGHSMGGAALLLAELERPGTLRRLVAIEPIVYPAPDGNPRPENYLAIASRKRRMVFASPEAAAENYLSKPHLGAIDPEVMADYTRHGMFERADGQWELKCPGDVEAQVYEGSSEHPAWGRLGEVHTPTLILRGGHMMQMPAQLAEEQVARMPDAELATLDGAGHFAPLEKPEEVAKLAAAFLSRP